MPTLINKFFIAAGLLSTIICRAQNTPILSQTTPAGNFIQLDPPAAVSVPSGLLNYIRTFTLQAQVQDTGMINNGTLPAIAAVSTLYKDGFNRDMQLVHHNFSIMQNDGHSLISPVDTRFRKGSQDYLAYSGHYSSGFQPNAFEEQQDYYSGLHPNEGNISYSNTQNTSTSESRSTSFYFPGKSQAGQSRGTMVTLVTNDAWSGTNQPTAVRIWKLDANEMPVSNGYYSANQLKGELRQNAESGNIYTFLDRSGKLICSSVYLEDISTGQTPTPVYASTYYVYDDLGRLRYIIPPKATGYFTGGTLSTLDLNNLCFSYKYDSKKRIAAQRIPGESDLTSIVYDRKNRPVMSQTPLQQDQNIWKVSFYDREDRVIATALYESAEQRDWWQNQIDNGIGGTSAADLSWYLMTVSGEGQAPSNNNLAGCTMLSYTYYDNYSASDPSGSVYDDLTNNLSFSEIQNSLGSEVPIRSKRTQGLTTATWVRILPAEGIDTAKTGDWRVSILYYDDKGRLIKTLSRDEFHSNVIHYDYTATQYNFNNQVLITKHISGNLQSAQGPQAHTELTKNEYETGTNRLYRTSHKIDTGPWRILSTYSYDALGRLKRKILGNNGEVQDFSYNIRNQLSGINSYYAVSGDRQGVSRTFGEALYYDYGFTKPRYDGKIAGMIWRGSGSSKANAYGYSYDIGGRLKTADYRQLDVQTPAFWTAVQRDYTVSNLTYDLNGNIKSMNQRATNYGGGIVTMDRLGYTYQNSDHSNRLQRVVDTAAFYDLGDFNNTNNYDDDYRYDLNGNLTRDNNKSIVSASYTYLNKPESILFGSGNRIDNSYDAMGTKIEENVLNGTSTNITKYLGNFVYRNDTLLYALTGEGRTTFNLTSNTTNEEFFVRDHLNNVRSVIDVYTYDIHDYLATYEVASANLEGLFFGNMDEVRDDKPGSSTPGDNKAGNLNGGDPNRQIGTSMLVKVMAGDKVAMNVNNFYEDYDKETDNPVNAGDMLGSLVGTLSGGIGGFEGSESHSASMVEDLFSVNNFSTYTSLVDANTDANKPKAYLNYLLFNDKMELVSEFSGAFQANGENGWSNIGTQNPMEIPLNGYLAVYLSNSSRNTACLSCSNVYFDQLSIQLTKGHLKEENHYYPFGLPMAAMGSSAENFVANNKRFQENDYVKDLGLNWMDFNARQYDPQIGRFLGVDPLAGKSEMLSPYSAMANDPVSIVDPEGLENTVYLINLPNSGISNANMKGIIAILNGWMKEYGIDVTFVLFEGEMGVEFSMSDLSYSDAVVVIGEPHEVSDYVHNNLGSTMHPDGDKWGNKDYPGATLRNISAVSSVGVKEDAKEVGGDFFTDLVFTILHEVGHPRKNEFGNISTGNEHTKGTENVIMWSGATIRSIIAHISSRDPKTGEFVYANKDERFKTYADMLKKEYNSGYIKSMKNFFDAGYSKDNRLNRHFNPNKSEWFYKTFSIN